MIFLLTRITVVLLTLAFLKGCGNEAKIDKLEEQGRAAYESKDYDKGIALLTKALRLNSENASAHLWRGYIYLSKGDFDKALKDYNECIRIDPTDSSSYEFRGSAYYTITNLDQALADYNEAIRLDPENGDAFAERGTLYYARTNLEQAIDDYSEAIRAGKETTEVYRYRGDAYLSLGEFEKALADYVKTTELDPEDAEANNLKAWILATCPDASVRNGHDAIEAAKKACEVTQWKNWQYLDTLAAAYAETGDFDEALTTQTKALAFDDTAKDQLPDMQHRLELYKQNLPYRDAAKR